MTLDYGVTRRSLTGGGEMGALIGAHDWASTPLGPMTAWPQSLKVAVRLLLNTRHPMFIWWGPELIQFYNDAYAASLGPEKHPSALGARGRETWPEIWDVIGPQISQVMSSGEATWHEDHLVPIMRGGSLDEVYWTYGFSPIDDEGAPHGVGGVLVICRETTAEVRVRRDTDERYRALFNAVDSGFCIVEVDLEAPGGRIDYRVVEANPAFHRQTGFPEAILGRSLREASPDLEEHWYETYGRVARTGEPARFEQGSDHLGRWFDVYAFPIGEPAQCRVAILFNDITARRNAELMLRDEEARQRFLLDLGDEVRTLASPREVIAATSRALGERLGATRVAYAEINEDSATVLEDWTDGIVAHLPTNIRLSDFGGPIIDHLHTGLTLRVDDVSADPLTVATLPALDAISARAIVSVPLLKDGRLVANLNVHQNRPRTWKNAEVELVEVVAERVWAAAERARAEAALRESEARLQLALEASGMVGLYDWHVPENRFFADARFARQFGVDPDRAAAGAPVARFTRRIHPDDRPRIEAAIRHAMATGEPYEAEYRLIQGDGEERWVAARGRCLRDSTGTPLRLSGTVVDITERKRAEERQALLAREVDHRAKNALAVVQAALRLTRTLDPHSYRQAIEGRVAALARAQTLLAVDRWVGADLRTLLQGELDGFLDGGSGSGPRAELSGPTVALPPGAAQPLAMAVHELATNAVKYGALSTPTGRVIVTWDLEGGSRRTLRLRWAEEGGPSVEGAPAHRGFGTRVLDGTVRHQLGGAMTLSWKAAGLVCDIELPLGRDPSRTTGMRDDIITAD